MTKPKRLYTSVRLDEADRDAIQAIANRHLKGNFSAALRYLVSVGINEYLETESLLPAHTGDQHDEQ